MNFDHTSGRTMDDKSLPRSLGEFQFGLAILARDSLTVLIFESLEL